MDIKKLAELLGLSEDATEEQVVEALKVCLAENRSLKETEKQPPENVVANKAVCELLGLKAGAAAEDVTAKIMELKSGTVDGVNLAEELKALKQQNAEREANDAVILALKAGKITPAQKEWAKSYALSDPKGFGSFVEKAPQIVPMDKIELDDVKALKSDALDADTLTPGGTVTARVTVKNSGAMRGAEVVQLYVADATGAPVPGGRVPQALRRFAKIALQPGEEREVVFTLTPQDISRYSPELHAWCAAPGRYEIRIGHSSRDIRAVLALQYADAKI